MSNFKVGDRVKIDADEIPYTSQGTVTDIDREAYYVTEDEFHGYGGNAWWHDTDLTPLDAVVTVSVPVEHAARMAEYLGALRYDGARHQEYLDTASENMPQHTRDYLEGSVAFSNAMLKLAGELLEARR